MTPVLHRDPYCICDGSCPWSLLGNTMEPQLANCHSDYDTSSVPPQWIMDVDASKIDQVNKSIHHNHLLTPYRNIQKYYQ